METGEEAVLFNSDTLVKIISYLPSLDLLNLALTSKRFGVSTNNNDEQSLIEKSTYVAVQEIGTEEQLAALPHYEGESSLADFHYLQLMREPLSFDQLVEAEYVNSGDKSCVINASSVNWGTAFSNNILRAGKHYVSFQLDFGTVTGTVNFILGVMRPGQANQNARGTPITASLFQNFSRYAMKHGKCNNSNVKCCLYNAYNDGKCYTSDWVDGTSYIVGTWEGSESMSSDGEIGMLLDLDEGTLSVYKNGRKLGVMKKGLAGPYCWVASMIPDVKVTIKRGVVPS